MSEQWEGRLREAAQKLTLSEEGRERILDGCNSRQKPVFMTRHRIKLAAALLSDCCIDTVFTGHESLG